MVPLSFNPRNVERSNIKKYYEALAAAEREVVRRQQLSIEADSVVKSAIADIDENSLDSARIKLKEQ